MTTQSEPRDDSRDLALRVITLLEVALDEVQRIGNSGLDQLHDLLKTSNSIWDAQLHLKHYVEKRDATRGGKPLIEML